jgi:tetratricopeptide (TPR) repeat protein
MGNLNTSYYLEAYDSYPYDLKQASESLNYALAYDDEHAPTLWLMGKMLYEQFKDLDSARHYFELAILYDKNYTDTYYVYIDLLLSIRDYAKAKIIIDKADEISSICSACLWSKKSAWFESQGLLKPAKEAIKIALEDSMNNEEITNLKADLARIKVKLKNQKKRLE